MKQRGKKKKRIERNEDNFRDLWDNVKCPNIRIIGVPGEEDKKKGHEKIPQDIIVNAGEGVEKREPSYTVGGNADWYSHYGKQCGDFLKNWK